MDVTPNFKKPTRGRRSPTAATLSVDPNQLPESILARIDVGECWIWTGTCINTGYAHIWWQGANRLGHRLTYRLLVGPIPEGLELDHLCRNRSCVNPAHLDPVTHRENMRRSGPATKSTCANGHPLSGPDVTVTVSGERVCRACQRARNRAYRARKGTS